MRGALAEAESQRRPVAARPGPDSSLLLANADRVAKEIEAATRAIRQVAGRLPSGADQKASEDLAARAEAVTQGAKQAREDLRKALPAGEYLFKHFGTGKFPDSAPAPPAEPAIEAASHAIKEHQPEPEVNRLLAAIPDETLHKAVVTAEDAVHAFENLREGPRTDLEKLSRSVKVLLPQAGALHQAVRAFESRLLFPDQPASASATRDQLKPLSAADDAVRQAAEELKQFWAAATDEFNTWRYGREADDNRHVAEVLEVQVHKSSYQSDQHHQRSQNLFYGMLAAQAGVVISSMAVAARRKSPLWLLASVAGILALGLSAWVYVSF
jgi:hypothetical protein